MTILNAMPESNSDVSVATPAPSPVDRAQAAWRAETVRTDAWEYANRLRGRLHREIFDRLPSKAQKRVLDYNVANRAENPKAREAALMEEAGLARAANSDNWNLLPTNTDEMTAEVDRRRKLELDEAESVLGIDGGGVAGFVGGGARAMTDQTSLMLAPFGLGGGIARVIAGEALLGAAGEAAILPREYEVADELGIAPPKPIQRILTGGAFGGVLGGAVVGGGRALSYGRERRAAARETRPEGVSDLDHQDDINAAYERMASGDEPELSLGEPEAAVPASQFQASTREVGSVSVNYDFGPNTKRSKPVSDDFLGKLRGVVAPLGDDIDIMITSGGQDRIGTRGAVRTGSPRHDIDATGHGNTADLVLTRNGRVVRPSEDRELYARFFHRAAAEFPGLGHYSWGVHVGSGSVAAWGPTTRSASLDPYFKEAIEAGRVGWKGWTPKPNAAYRATGTPDSGANFAGYTSRGYTGTGQVSVGDNMRIDVKYEVVDVSLLRQASGDLQPRDRGRVASDVWVSDTAARLDPAQLMPAPTADRGAPIVGPDNMIESGNGRVRAIERAYERHPDRAAAYRKQIELLTGGAIPEGINNPVLIARRSTDLDTAARRNLVVEAQDSGVARMNATERAQVGQRALQSDMMQKFRPDFKLTAAENSGFARSFAGAFPRSERNAFFDKSGAMSIDGVRQVQDAMFARAYEAPDILARYVETEAGELRSLMDALSSAAPDIALLRAEIDAGLIRPEMDITPFILDAARLIMAARDLAAREGSTAAKVVSDMLADIDLLDGAVAPLTQALVRHMMPAGRQAPADKIAGFLKRYVREARKTGKTGDALDSPPGPIDVLKAIDKDAFGDLSETGFARLHDVADPVVETETMPEAAFVDGAQSPEARLGDDVAARDLMEGEADPVMSFDLPDGTNISLREFLDDLEADETLEAVLDACNLGGGT